jgi:hypothetical protein
VNQRATGAAGLHGGAKLGTPVIGPARVEAGRVVCTAPERVGEDATEAEVGGNTGRTVAVPRAVVS